MCCRANSVIMWESIVGKEFSSMYVANAVGYDSAGGVIKAASFRSTFPMEVY